MFSFEAFDDGAKPVLRGQVFGPEKLLYDRVRPPNRVTASLKHSATEQIIREIYYRMRVALGLNEFAEQPLEFPNREYLLRVPSEARQKLTLRFKTHSIGSIRVASDLKCNKTSDEPAHCGGAKIGRASCRERG